jgi:hypothetical protein
MEPYTHKYLKRLEKSEKREKKVEEGDDAENVDYDPLVFKFKIYSDIRMK